MQKIELNPSVSIIIAGALIAAAIVFINVRPDAPAQAAGDGALPGNTSVPAPSASDHILGSPTASVMLVEYSDFQCIYCSKVYPTIKRIVHMDLYRMTNADHLSGLAIEDVRNAQTVVFIEWPDIFGKEVFVPDVRVKMQVTGEIGREINIE